MGVRACDRRAPCICSLLLSSPLLYSALLCRSPQLRHSLLTAPCIHVPQNLRGQNQLASDSRHKGKHVSPETRTVRARISVERSELRRGVRELPIGRHAKERVAFREERDR